MEKYTFAWKSIRKMKQMRKQKVVELNLFAPSDFGEEEESVSLSNSSLTGTNSSLTREEVQESKVAPATIASLFLRLSQSKFRSSFYLNQKDKDIIAHKGLATIREHAQQIIAKRLAPAFIPNDGKQTPMRHGTSPVFIAQHATGCCCRGCLEKWHHIPKGRALTAEEQAYVVEVLMHWIETH